MQVDPSDAFEVLCCIPAPSLTYNQPGICYTLVRLPDDDSSAGTNPPKGRDTYIITDALFELFKCGDTRSAFKNMVLFLN